MEKSVDLSVNVLTLEVFTSSMVIPSLFRSLKLLIVIDIDQYDPSYIVICLSAISARPILNMFCM